MAWKPGNGVVCTFIVPLIEIEENAGVQNTPEPLAGWTLHLRILALA
jgi:hypothetical protein